MIVFFSPDNLDPTLSAKTQFFKPLWARRLRLGFSLVEVAIAMSIASLAVTVLLGLVPAGLNALKDASSNQVKTSAYRQMLSEINTADWGRAGGAGGWSGLTPFANTKRFFDDQGSIIQPDDYKAMSSRVSFVGRFSFPNRGVILPGATGAGQEMILLTIDFAQTADTDYDFNDPTLHDSRTMVVTKMR